jgi:predicted ATPase
VIASVAFRNFKALRSAQLVLAPFNLIIGPNGSGKTSLIQALLRLRSLARLPLREPVPEGERLPEAAEISFRFNPPHDGLEAVLACVDEASCDLLQLTPLPRGEGVDDWPGLRTRLLTLRSYVLDHLAITSTGAGRSNGNKLASHGGNLAAVLAVRRELAPGYYTALCEELTELFPEFSDLVLLPELGSFGLRLRDGGDIVPADNLSQGTLYTLALLAIAHDPTPPAIVCIEELDRGLHPRLLRGVRDVLYRLSYPSDYGHDRAPVQVIATTHSPLMLDLFRDHPEEVVIADKVGRAATFARLADRADLADLLTEGASLGDLWYSGILGGVPEEP